MSIQPLTTPLDVMAVLADLQQQLTDVTGIVQAQQRTLQHLLGDPDPNPGAGADLAATPVGAGTVRPALRRP